MTQPVPNQNYSASTGSNSTSVFITQFAQRNPTVNDLNYPISKRWVNTLTAKEFILMSFTSIGSVTQATWINLTNGSASALDELTGNTGGSILPDGSGNINVRGDSTTIQVVGTTNTLTANVVLPVTPHSVLVGEGDSIAGIAPGTTGQVLTAQTGSDPIWADSGGALSLGAFGSTPNADAASLIGGVLTLEPANATNPGGLSNSPQTLGSGVKTFTDSPIIPLTGILTGNNTTAVTASAITDFSVLTGGAANAIVSVGPGATSGIPLVNNAGAAPTYSTALVVGGGTGAVTFPIDGVVVSGATTTSALSAQTLASGQFVIGATGAAPLAGTITAGPGITVTPGANSITVSSTATGFIWLSEVANFNAIAGHGYSISSSITATLPLAPALGDTISFFVYGAATLIIQASAGAQILVGASSSSTAGTCTNSENNNSITLTCIHATATIYWGSINAPQGTWLCA